MACSPITTLIVFGSKNLCLSFYRPGSLVVLTSSVSCLFLDADTLAVLKAAYSLLGQTLGKRAANRTVARQLEKHRQSIVAAAGGSATATGTGWIAATAVETSVRIASRSPAVLEASALFWRVARGPRPPPL
jgi:hypothetical protein